jgi:hypothetical protein
MSDTNKVKKLLEIGCEITGAVAGGAIGLIGGPAGALGGGAAGVVVAKGLIEFANRYLSHREQARVGAAAGLTIVSIEDRIKNGQVLRQDNFFEADEINRSKAEELFEGILLKCKNEYEEKKISYITKIYEQVAFDTSIKPEHANQVLNTAQQLSYRQLILLAFVGRNEDNKYQLREISYRDDTLSFTSDLQFLLQDFVVLERQGLIFRNDDTTILDLADVAPGSMALTLIGQDYYKLLGLSEMPESEFTFIDMIS